MARLAEASANAANVMIANSKAWDESFDNLTAGNGELDKYFDKRPAVLRKPSPEEHHAAMRKQFEKINQAAAQSATAQTTQAQGGKLRPWAEGLTPEQLAKVADVIAEEQTKRDIDSLTDDEPDEEYEA
jgi:hypothetical protein